MNPILNLSKIVLPNEIIDLIINSHFPKLLKTDVEESINYDEFYNFCLDREDTSSFLWTYYQIQTRTNALGRYVNFLESLEEIFNKKIIKYENKKSYYLSREIMKRNTIRTVIGTKSKNEYSDREYSIEKVKIY